MIMADPERKTHSIVGVPSHPLPSGHVFQSPGSQFSYRVIGPCCRLFDREQLPWPCCRLQWRGKEPSWRRMGKRLIVDISTKRYPSYNVELIGYPKPMKPLILTLYTERLSAVDQEWWHSKKMQKISP
jgi:hypothetical protein